MHANVTSPTAPLEGMCSWVVPLERGEPLVLADGTRLLIRPLGADDRDGLASLFDRLSPRSRGSRFHGTKTELTTRELEFFTNIDHVRHAAFAAVDQRDASIVGVGRYVSHRERHAEVAFEVVDDLQNMGIGTALACRVLQRAQATGMQGLNAFVLWDNRPARALLRRLGFRARGSEGGEIELELELAARV